MAARMRTLKCCDVASTLRSVCTAAVTHDGCTDGSSGLRMAMPSAWQAVHWTLAVPREVLTEI